ncbi:MAG: hypothetical protein AB7N76_02975 [Planctomycetota bacterium]
MSDEKLRELERRFRETGSAEDEVAWLRERARSGEKLDWESYSRLHELDVDAAADYLRWRVATGDLTQERLELAAYCGEVGRVSRQLRTDAFLQSLGRWGPAPFAEVLRQVLLASIQKRPNIPEVVAILKPALRALEEGGDLGVLPAAYASGDSGRNLAVLQASALYSSIRCFSTRRKRLWRPVLSAMQAAGLCTGESVPPERVLKQLWRWALGYGRDGDGITLGTGAIPP